MSASTPDSSADVNRERTSQHAVNHEADRQELFYSLFFAVDCLFVACGSWSSRSKENQRWELFLCMLLRTVDFISSVQQERKARSNPSHHCFRWILAFLVRELLGCQKKRLMHRYPRCKSILSVSWQHYIRIHVSTMTRRNFSNQRVTINRNRPMRQCRHRRSQANS